MQYIFIYIYIYIYIYKVPIFQLLYNSLRLEETKEKD